MHRVPLLGLAALLGLACSQGSPRGASAADHERMAEREERAARAHDHAVAQAAGPRGSGQELPDEARDHRRRAGEHRQVAARHRAAARQIRAGEEHSCAGIADEERALDPFRDRGEITSVSPIEEQPAAALDAPSDTETTGARIVLRARPSLTAEWLQRTVNCYMARASSGPQTPDMAASPLAVEDAEAVVTSTGDGFAIDVTSDDRGKVQEIIRRAEALAR